MDVKEPNIYQLKAHNVDADKDNGKSAVSLIKKITTQLAVPATSLASIGCHHEGNTQIKYRLDKDKSVADFFL